MGYLGMGEEMKGCYDDQGWLMTGDKGHSDEDGFLFVTGRLKGFKSYKITCHSKIPMLDTCFLQ